MSGICGILRLDGARPDGIEGMSARLRDRGPEGVQHFRDGPCALGHTLLATTPEALHETMPLTHLGTGCTITADIRLDNRDVLCSALGLDLNERVIGDGELVLLAYLHWGEDCPLHLLGDFAFAIWDPRKERIFAARDHMGMKQLIHCRVAGRTWAFASEPVAVLAAPDIPTHLNEGRIADFLEEYLEGIDFTETFFESVLRLPPAHCMTITKSGPEIRRYWTLTAPPPLKLPDDAAYEEAFRTVFTKAVQARLRSDGPVGSMLSGGMDSGSVVAIATRLLAAQQKGPLHTFSAVGPEPATCVETRTIRTAQTMPGLDAHEVNHADLAPLADDLIRLTENSAEPFDAHMVLVRSMYLSAHRSGIKVVLDGVAGDIVLTAGSQLASLIKRGRLWQAWREARGLEQFYDAGRGTRTFLRGFREAFAPNFLRKIRARKRAQRDHSPYGNLIDPAFADRIKLSERVARYRKNTTAGRSAQALQRARTITTTDLTTGRERYDRVASHCAIEPRDPFMDIRLIEFCLSLPQSQVERNGWRKSILRRAMNGKLPESVMWRKGKEHLGSDFVKALTLHGKVELEAVDQTPVNLDGIIRSSFLKGAGLITLKQLTSHEEFSYWALTSWLRTNIKHSNTKHIEDN